MQQVVVSQQTGYARNPSESAYPNLWRGLVGWWLPSVNPRGGNRLFDLSPFRNHGTLTNMTSEDWVVSGGAGALDFDGSNDYVSIPFQQNTTGNLTVSGYATSRINDSGVYAIIADSDATGSILPYQLELFQGKWGFIWGSGPYERLQSSTTISTNRWYHVAMTRRGVAGSWSFAFYIDGVLDFSGTSSVAVGSNQGVAIGRNGLRAAQLFNGQLDDVRLYSRALSYAEIRLLASKRGIGLQPRPKQFTYYQFPSGSKRRRILTGMT